MSCTNFHEIWVDGPNGQKLGALVNGDLGWLMYLRGPDDAGFSSRNPDYAGPVEKNIEYILKNGQIDHYPAAWAYPTATIMQAIEYFKAEGFPPAFIGWHNDSGDGGAPQFGPNHSFNPDALTRTG